MIVALLPKSAASPQWWAGPGRDDAPAVQIRAWTSAGFDASLVTGQDRVRFRRR